MRWHPAPLSGVGPDPDGPITEFRQYQGQLYRTIVRREPYGAADRTIWTPHAAVAMAADLEDPRNLFLGGAVPGASSRSGRRSTPIPRRRTRSGR